MGGLADGLPNLGSYTADTTPQTQIPQPQSPVPYFHPRKTQVVFSPVSALCSALHTSFPIRVIEALSSKTLLVIPHLRIHSNAARSTFSPFMRPLQPPWPAGSGSQETSSSTTQAPFRAWGFGLGFRVPDTTQVPITTIGVAGFGS